MQAEIEVKFLSVNHNEIRGRLKTLGATCKQPMRPMLRAIMDFPGRRLQTKKQGWVRVRDEGDKITITYKQTNEGEFGGAYEIEFVASSYEKAVEFMRAIGLETQAEQESKRETWELDGVEIVLDEWPWIEPFIEIEGHSEAAVKEMATRLGYKWDDAVFGSVISIYRLQYPDIDHDRQVSQIPRIAFNTKRPEWFVKEKA